MTFHIDPQQLDAFFEALKPAYDAVTAEPECAFFEIYRDPNVPGKIKFVENWNASLEWLTTVRAKFPIPPLHRQNCAWLDIVRQ